MKNPMHWGEDTNNVLKTAGLLAFGIIISLLVVGGGLVVLVRVFQMM